MKIKLLFLLLVAALTVNAQSVELFGGLNKNFFYDNEGNEGHYRSKYSSGESYTFGLGIDSVKVDWLVLKFSLLFDNYRGKIEVSDGGLGSDETIKATIDKSVISFGIFPLNFRIKKVIDLNFGFEISQLLYEKFSGTYSSWSMGGTPYTNQYFNYDLNEKYNKLSSRTYFGFCANISYDFYLSKSIVISPKYSCYLGLSKEFTDSPEIYTKSIRHYLLIGIEKKFNK